MKRNICFILFFLTMFAFSFGEGVDMSIPLKTSQGGETTLAALAKGSKGLLIDFWASWCGPCIQLMPNLKEKASQVTPQGVVVVGMNLEGSIEKADTIRKRYDIDFSWLIEGQGRPYSRSFNISTIPRMVLLTPEGQVLFNGHPMDSELKVILETIGVHLKP